jgi:hypothetical protein
MFKYIFLVIVSVIFFTSCATKQPTKTATATILFKTPTIKFYDKGFIKKYDDFIELNILNAGKSVLYLKIYKDKVCTSLLKCISSKDFNKQYFNTNLQDDFLYNIFSQNKIYFKDKQRHTFIKVVYDK